MSDHFGVSLFQEAPKRRVLLASFFPIYCSSVAPVSFQFGLILLNRNQPNASFNISSMQQLDYYIYILVRTLQHFCKYSSWHRVWTFKQQSTGE
jgi:hypothetical protein